MWTMEDVLSELSDGNNNNNNNEGNGLPPGFRFHPTDEELITFYLVSKVFYESNNNIATPVRIAEVDLNRCEPWDLPERAKMGEKEWYLYSLRDRKYPTGLRTNRATGTGYWKATGKDRQVHATSISTTPGVSAGHGGCGSGVLIGMKKTLVFYQGRAPRGLKTRWVMHEYRLDGHFSTFRLSSKEEWVICRIFYKHGGEKKTSYHPQAPPLSPLLRCLPPLMDAHPNPSSSSTTAVNDNNASTLPHSQNHDTNFLLQSLLSNTHNSFTSMTQPNTSFTTNASTLTAAAAAAAAPSAFLLKSFHHLPSLTSSTAVAHSIDNHQYQHWFDKISQIIPSETHYSFDEMDVHPNGYATAANVDMPSSVFALDRLLHPHINLPAESWPLHP